MGYENKIDISFLTETLFFNQEHSQEWFYQCYSSMYQEGYIRNIHDLLLPLDSYKCYVSNLCICSSLIQRLDKLLSGLSSFHSQWIRKVPHHSPSGTFLSQTSLFIYVHVVYQIIGNFSNKSNGVVKSKFQKK